MNMDHENFKTLKVLNLVTKSQSIVHHYDNVVINTNFVNPSRMMFTRRQSYKEGLSFACSKRWQWNSVFIFVIQIRHMINRIYTDVFTKNLANRFIQ